MVATDYAADQVAESVLTPWVGSVLTPWVGRVFESEVGSVPVSDAEGVSKVFDDSLVRSDAETWSYD